MAIPKIPTIKVTCGSTDCENGHHAFNDPSHEYKKRGHGRTHLQPGVCKSCGADVVDWARLHKRDIKDAAHTFEALQHEFIRWKFWNDEFNEKSRARFANDGMDATLASVRPTLEKTIGPVAESKWSMQQVPTAPDKLSKVIEYAQHAVAACCRNCVARWHGIPNAKPLPDRELKYLTALVVEYLRIRLPPNENLRKA
jgi:hypothetical protein